MAPRLARRDVEASGGVEGVVLELEVKEDLALHAGATPSAGDRRGRRIANACGVGAGAP